jgi:hypothetical protein
MWGPSGCCLSVLKTGRGRGREGGWSSVAPLRLRRLICAGRGGEGGLASQVRCRKALRTHRIRLPLLRARVRREDRRALGGAATASAYPPLPWTSSPYTTAAQADAHCYEAMVLTTAARQPCIHRYKIRKKPIVACAESPLASRSRRRPQARGSAIQASSLSPSSARHLKPSSSSRAVPRAARSAGHARAAGAQPRTSAPSLLANTSCEEEIELARSRAATVRPLSPVLLVLHVVHRKA